MPPEKIIHSHSFLQIKTHFVQKNTQLLNRFILVLVIFLTLAVSYLAYDKITNLISYGKSVEHTYEVINTIQATMSSIKDAETGQRGFLLTNNSSFLKSFYNSKGNIPEIVKKLAYLTSDNRDQQFKVDSLKSFVKHRFNQLDYVLSVFIESSGNNILIDSLKTGKKVMENITSLALRMQTIEENMMQKRMEIKERTAAVTPLFILVITLISLFLIIISYSIINSELQKRIAVQKELEIKVEELNRSNSELEQFAYVASHDLQEPLRKIRSFGDRLIIKHKSNLNEDAQFTVDKMRNAAERMQILIDDLLGFSRLINAVREFAKTDLNELLRVVLDDLDETIRLKKAIVHSEKLPVADVVPSQLRQLFQNLISNSLKFSRENVPPQISIFSERISGIDIPGAPAIQSKSEFYKITVKDNGIGFDKQYLDRMFIIFQRLHGKLEYGGTGIGLAVCKKIVANHGGYISADSTPGNGASFYIYIPVARV